MKAALVIIATLIAAAAGQRGGFGGGFGGGRGGGGDLSDKYGATPYEPQVFRNVYVHTAPDEPEDRSSKVIRVPGGDKHVNILFVKTGGSSSSHQTEVVLPEQDEHKNIVYVLLKKGESSQNVKITRPQAKTPAKPEVNFIRYGGETGTGY